MMPSNIKTFAAQVRLEALRMVHRARASHIGGALSMADILAVLYAPGGRLSINHADPRWPQRDRFILSKGHACTSLYAALGLRGFFPLEDLTTYAQSGSPLMSHASHHVAGVELSTGSLGHGLPVGCGLALAAKRRYELWRTVVLLSDGEMDEGSNWESFLFAPQHSLDNLWVVIDANGIQSLGDVKDVLDLEPLADKLRAFRWSVIELDGHDHEALYRALDLEHAPMSGRPTVIIARTVKGKGVGFMENSLEWHYKSPSDVQLAEAIAGLEGDLHA